MFLGMICTIFFTRISVMRFVLSAFANMMVFEVDLMFTTVFSFKGEAPKCFFALGNMMFSNRN